MDFDEELRQRMLRPQRHRLLQGFPAVPAMERAVPFEGPGAEAMLRGVDGGLDDSAFSRASAGHDPRGRQHRSAAPDPRDVDQRVQAVIARGDRAEPPYLDVDSSRSLIVGIIPHTQCTPAREGCGFCTFPHDRPDEDTRKETATRLFLDLISVTGLALSDHRAGAFSERRVDAVYLGGGTATLSAPDELRDLVEGLAEAFRLDDAELTLEGTANSFDRFVSSHLSSLMKLKVGTRRISMGLQTFDPRFLALMGRQKFGSVDTVRALERKCRRLGIATSGDLLFNLPGQTSAQMDADVETALSCGLDQICLYNLVLTPGTGWAKDPTMVAAIRSSEDACEQWLRLRARLLTEGYVQTTLTNFEREDVVTSPRRFRYELAGFSVETTDALGFGPMSLTTVVNLSQKRGLKLMRRKDVSRGPWSGGDLMYRYDDAGLSRLFVTRGLAKLKLDGTLYGQLFGRSLDDDFPALPTLVRRGLVERIGADVRLTPTGMFFADTVVSLLAMGAPRTGAGLRTMDLLKEPSKPGEYLGMG